MNVAWISFKQRSLDDNGLYVLGGRGQPQSHVELTKDEKRWNVELREAEREQAEPEVARDESVAPAAPAA